eukprot:GFUD01001735.1.p1 GENE.GFUD01001735.1~~GFUD01001735.1.p1  ORF type:complete len:946 (+),score=311.07 GFUD01001735.1:78-2915(+)
MKNLEIIGAASEADSAIAEMEMEVDSPAISAEALKQNIPEKVSDEKADIAAEVVTNGVESAETNRGISSVADIKVDSDEKVGDACSTGEKSVEEKSKDSKSSDPSELNGDLTDEIATDEVDTSKVCNGAILNGDVTLENVDKDKPVPVLSNGDLNAAEPVGEKESKLESNEGIAACEIVKPSNLGGPDSSLNKNNNAHKVDDIKDTDEDVFKMPNSIEELLDEEVLKDDASDIPGGIDRDEVFNEMDTSTEDLVEEMEVELSKAGEESKHKNENGSSELDKPDPNKDDNSVNGMETSDGEKMISQDKVDGNNEDAKDTKDNLGNKDVINPFVDETSPESDEDLLKEAEKKKNLSSKEEEEKKPSQISLVSVDGSDEENSDDDLDINAGLDKCFSALEKEISKDETSEASSPSAVNNMEKKPEEAKKDKTVYVDDSSRETMDASRDASNVPSEAEEGGNEADDEDDKERMSVEPEPEEPVDLDQALGELEMIEKTTKRILDDESESLKRPNEETTEPVSKKVRVDESLEETVEVVEAIKKKKLKKELKKMSRNDLEDLIANKMVEVMTNKSEIGKLRHQCDSFQETVEKWKRRAQALSKQCTDLSTVMRKYITDSKNRPRDKVAPVRITRSVGLQVMTPDQRRLQQQRQNMNRMNRTQDKAVAPGAVQQSTPAKTIVNSVNSLKQQQTNGLDKVATPQLPRTVGGTTISPAKTTTTPIRTSGSVTITQTKTPSTTPKPVIDVVDLSDDESTPAPPPPPKPAPQPVRQLPTGLVRSSGPRQQGQQFIMQGNQLYPVRQGMARQNMPGHRPMMGSRPRAQMRSVHPAPLPPMPNPQPNSPNWKLLPPRPALKISRVANGIVLSWNMNLNLATHATIASYQLYAYQESAMQRPDSSLWKKVGDVKALPLPMACTLTQFTRGNKYHFAVRAMDGHSRVGQFSDPNSIVLN